MTAPPTEQLDLAQALLLTLDRASALVPCAGAAIVLRDGRMARVIAAQCLRTGEPFALAGAPLLARAFELHQAQGVVAPAGEDSFFAPLLSVKDAHAFLVPIPLPGRRRDAASLLVVWRSEGTPFSAREIGALEGIAHQSGLMIDHARRYADLQRQSQYLDAAAQIGRHVTLQLDVEALLAESMRILRERFGFYQAHLLLIDEAADELVLRVSSGLSANVGRRLGLRLKVGAQGITGWVAAHGEPLLCNDVSRDSRFFSLSASPATRSELAVPLQLANRIIGVLDVQDDHVDRFHATDQLGLQVVADQIAIALDNARLFGETRRRLAAMHGLHAVSLDIAAQLNLEDLLATLLQRAGRLVQAESVALYKYDPASGVIGNLASYQTGSDWTARPGIVGHGMVGLVVEAGAPLIVDDYATWEEALPEFRSTPLPVRLCVPLRWQAEVTGALMVLNPADAHRFDADDQEVLSAFADLCAVAVKNAELYTQVASFGHTLEAQVTERTRELQEARGELLAKAEQVQWLLSKTVHIQEEERARIARDLHDSVSQLAIGALYELHAAKSALDGGERPDERIDTARDLLRQIEREIRQAIHGLRPTLLDASGLPTALQKYAESVQGLSGLTCTVQISGTPVTLPPPVEVVIFRIVQEALHNVTTHAHASAARVTLEFQPRQLRLEIADDGQGFNVATANGESGGLHVGLAGMRERAAVIGAQLQVQSGPGRGTRIVLRAALQPG